MRTDESSCVGNKDGTHGHGPASPCTLLGYSRSPSAWRQEATYPANPSPVVARNDRQCGNRDQTKSGASDQFLV